MTKKGLFIGLTTLDIQYFVEEYPQANTKVKTDRPMVFAGGPAANAAITYVHLGGDADMVTCIGKNPFQHFLCDDYRRCGVNVIDFVSGEAFQPILATVITTTSNSERTILTHHPEPLKKEYRDELIRLNDYDFVFIDGFYPEIAKPICAVANKLGVPVIFDGGSWKPQLPQLLPLINVAICSNNYRPPGCETLEQAIAFTQNEGVNYVAISRGSENIVTAQKEIQVEPIDAVDSLGAGDVLHGAFCWYWINQKRKFNDALAEAAKIASKSVLSKGTRAWME